MQGGKKSLVTKISPIILERRQKYVHFSNTQYYLLCLTKRKPEWQTFRLCCLKFIFYLIFFHFRALEQLMWNWFINILRNKYHLLPSESLLVFDSTILKEWISILLLQLQKLWGHWVYTQILHSSPTDRDCLTYSSSGKIFGVKVAGKLGRQGGGPGFNNLQLSLL